MKMFRCTQCSRSFTRRENLNRHSKTHDRVLPHRCRFCQKQFSRSDLVRKHELLHEKHKDCADWSPVVPRSLQQATRSPSMTLEETALAPSPPLANQAVAAASAPNIHHHYPILSPTEPDAQRETDREDGIGFSDLASFTNAYADYAPFSHPWDDTGLGPREGNWLTLDFCEALYETGCCQLHNGGGDAGSIAMPTPTGVGRSESTHLFEKRHELLANITVNNAPRICRHPSPLDYPSNEEPCPFTSPAPGSHTQPISVEENDPLLQNHNSEFDITLATWGRLQQFLASSSALNGKFSLPPLEVTNIFIGLFFKFFAPTAPVLHQPTLDIDSLPPSLLAVMVAIGAEQTRLRGTRHFGILVLDHVRRNIQAAIDADRTITRDPVVIYTYALICYAGIWSGNGRLFEIAETLHGSLVAYIHRLPNNQDTVDAAVDIKDRWLVWRKIEFKRRLMWFIFMIDAQFPALLNTRSMLSLSEVAKWQCPCDEGYWVAPSALIWKSLLGPASLPPAPHFATAIAPFIYHLQLGAAVTRMPTLLLNPWSSFLVALSMSHSALEWSHKWALTVSIVLEMTEDGDVGNTLYGGQDDSRYRHLMESRQDILAALDRWYLHYGNPGGETSTYSREKAYFCDGALLIYRLTRMLLHVSLSDLQDVIAEDRPQRIGRTMHRIKVWARTNGFGYKPRPGQSIEGDLAPQAVGTAIEAADLVATLTGSPLVSATMPYSIITLFLSYLTLWAFSLTASHESKQELMRYLRQSPVLQPLERVMEPALEREVSIESEEARSIFRHAAYALTKLDTGGLSLSVALMLLRRSEV